MLKFLSKEIVRKLPEVKNSAYLASKKKRFHKEGLFSEIIFGPTYNYRCACGKYHGKPIEEDPDVHCKVCGVNYTYSKFKRRRQHARINLPIKVVNPFFLKYISKIFGENHTLIKTIKNLMNNEHNYFYWDKDREGSDDVILYYYSGVDDEEMPSPEAKLLTLHESIDYLVKDNCEELISIGMSEYQQILNNIDHLFIEDVFINPPDFRPIIQKTDSKNVDKMNEFYYRLLNKKELFIKTDFNINTNRSLYYTYYIQFQKIVNELFEHVIEKLSKKEGIIRSNILGKRMDFSARAVIAPDPTLSLNECVLPYKMVLELFRLRISRYLTESGAFRFTNRALKLIDDCIVKNDPMLLSVCEKIVEDEVCLLNRQPSLHRLGMVGFNIKVRYVSVIYIHPLVCEGFNADFDGDTMAVHIPLSKEAKAEVLDKTLASRNLITPGNLTLSTKPSQDMVLGLYYLSSNKVKKLSMMTEYKGVQMTEGQKILNECFPEQYPPILESLDSSKIGFHLNLVYLDYPGEIVETLDKVKFVGFKYATVVGCTMSLENVHEMKDLKSEIFAIESSKEQLRLLNDESIMEKVEDNFEYSYIVKCGARGKMDQVKQMVFCRGYVSNFQGQIVQTPIKNSFCDGLTKKEFFISSYGARKGLLDVAVKTSDSGYLFRKTLYSMVNLMLDDCENDSDCGTTDYLSIFVNDAKKAFSLIGKWFINNPGETELLNLTHKNYTTVIGKTIFIRTPIYCKNERLCKRCFGETWRVFRSRYVGVIAAQSLGEVNTQLVLRTFHTSLKSDTLIMDVNCNTYTIEDVYNKVKLGGDFYTFSCSPEGKIEVSKVVDAHRDRFEKTVLKITLDNGEFIESSLDHEWIKRNGEAIRADELKIGDSLMPIYSDTKDGYKTVKQNIQMKYHPNSRIDFVYHLSAQHGDVNIDKNLQNDSKHHCHHIDKNKLNDIPTNILIMNENNHILLHSPDAVKARDSEKMKIVVSESNKRRCQNPDFIKKFNEKRNKTMVDNNIYDQINESRKKFFEANPNHGSACFQKARLTMIQNNIQAVIDNGLELTNESYEEIRINNRKIPTFEYVQNNYPELIEKFIIIEPVFKPHNQIQAETRVAKILCVLKDKNLEFSEINFDAANATIYPDARFRWGREALDRLSPNCLDFLQNNHKITKIELITYDEPQNLYDLTVDSEHHNFATGAGVFIHNSGVAQITQTQKKDKSKNKGSGDIQQQDIIGALSAISKLLHKFTNITHPGQITEELYNIYNESRKLNHIHFECLVSQLMWTDKNTKWRLEKNRDTTPFTFVSIQSIPAKESWRLGIAFSNTRRELINGLIRTDKQYEGPIDVFLNGKEF